MMETALVALALLLLTAWILRRSPDSEARSGSVEPGVAPVVMDPPVVEVPIEDALDLHSFPPAEVPSVVEAYLEAAAEKGLTEVRLIHGRGQGVQRERVRSLLQRHPLVESFADAPPERGGWGATIAKLEVRSSKFEV